MQLLLITTRQPIADGIRIILDMNRLLFPTQMASLLTQTFLTDLGFWKMKTEALHIVPIFFPHYLISLVLWLHLLERPLVTMVHIPEGIQLLTDHSLLIQMDLPRDFSILERVVADGTPFGWIRTKT